MVFGAIFSPTVTVMESEGERNTPLLAELQKPRINPRDIFFVEKHRAERHWRVKGSDQLIPIEIKGANHLVDKSRILAGKHPERISYLILKL